MASRKNLLAVILGGGAGSRLFPLTRDRSKPAVPLGGKYRLVDVPISISVVSPEILASTNSKNLNELSGAVPGIQFNGNGGGGRNCTRLNR